MKSKKSDRETVVAIKDEYHKFLTTLKKLQEEQNELLSKYISELEDLRIEELRKEVHNRK
jgi:hypothetical protein